MSKRHFTPAAFAFLRDLKNHNDRDWFNAHKERYEQALREPALEFIRDFELELERISPYFRADDRRSGGSLFRIYRDTRFSRDKSPYKTYTGIQFRHEQGKDVHCPGFYLHLEPRSVFAGVGIWHPDSATLGRIREALLDDPVGWQRVLSEPDFADRFELAGDSLQRPPRGVPRDHPLIRDLKRKDFIAVTHLRQSEVTAAGFLDRFAGLCRAGAPLVQYLCDAVGVPF